VFVIWWIYAFLNDSEGRLYRWTDGKHGKTPVEVQKALDAKAAEKKAADKNKTAADASTVTTTNATPAK
jgi:pyruvate/oxaloacetate carboxyltransferase